MGTISSWWTAWIDTHKSPRGQTAVSDAGNDISPFGKATSQRFSSKRCEFKEGIYPKSEIFHWLFFPQQISLQTLATSIKCLYLFSPSHTDSNMCRHIDRISLNLCCRNPNSAARGHAWLTKAFSQLHCSVTVCCNTDTCTSVRQRSINNNSNN